jgi:predicted HNH restriction endonuclease
MIDREYEGESKGVRARGRSSGKSFIILKGSDAVGDEQVMASLSWVKKRPKLRQELISNRTLTKYGDHYRFQKDHTFKSSSQAASIIWGSNLNGQKVFRLKESPRPSVRTSLLDEAPQPSPVLTFPIDDKRAVEGYKKDQQLYMTTRNTELAKLRKQHDDYTCQACGFKLQVSEHFVIECHHTDPISWGVRETSLNDLVSLCPTCHRIAHTREPIYTVAEIDSIRQG